jgi:ribosome maturation factor RimP
LFFHILEAGTALSGWPEGLPFFWRFGRRKACKRKAETTMNAPFSPEALTRLITPLAASMDLELWGLELAHGGRSLVRVYVESPAGVSVDQCAELSRLIGLTLDVEDCMSGPYVLEVSSPGLERPFFRPEQLVPYAGRVVEAQLHEPAKGHPGRRNFVGELLEAKDGRFTLRLHGLPGAEEALLVFAWDEAKKIRLVHFLPEAEGRGKGRKARSKKPESKKTADAAGANAPEGRGPLDHSGGLP